MPYRIQKKPCCKVCKKTGGKCFSKKPLSKGKALAQLKAILASEKKKKKK